MKIKIIVFVTFFLYTLNSYSQKNIFSIGLGHNTGFVNSISRVSQSGIYSYSKNNKNNDDLIITPNFNIGLNYERLLFTNFSLFLGVHSSRTESALVFKNFNNPADKSSFVKYGYSVNTFEFPIGIVNTFSIFNYLRLKNYFAITINLNGLTEGTVRYRLISQSTNSDTISMNFTDIMGFPSGNSMGIRYGIGITPFKKFSNWEIGAYLNIQFKRSLIWDQEVEFENVSQNTYEYHHAILKDKPDYLNFHLKYTFIKF